MPVPQPCIEDSDSIALSMDGVNLRADVIQSERVGNDLQLLPDGVFVAGFQVVNVLPLQDQVQDGDRVILHATLGEDEASGSAWSWPLQYVAAIGGGVWIPLGGAPYVGFNNGQGSLAPGGGSTWADLSGTDVAGPSINLPADGAYVFRIGANIGSPANGTLARMGLSIAGGTPSAQNTITTAHTNTSAIAGSKLLTGRVRGEVVSCLYNADGSTGTATFVRRYMEVLPFQLKSPTS